MIALDTNILARFYIDESDKEAKKQNVIATEIMGQSALFVARTVIMELEWVLRGGYGYPASGGRRKQMHLSSYNERGKSGDTEFIVIPVTPSFPLPRHSHEHTQPSFPVTLAKAGGKRESS